MQALLIFGQKFGSDNAPLIELGRKIAGLGNSVTFAHWDDEIIELSNIDIVVGHSFGGASAVELSKRSLYPIRYMALIDPVADWFPLNFKNYWKRFEIPSNVQKADCFTRAFNLIPPAGQIENVNDYDVMLTSLPPKPVYKYFNHTGIASSHAEMPANKLVVSTILDSIKQL